MTMKHHGMLSRMYWLIGFCNINIKLGFDAMFSFIRWLPTFTSDLSLASPLNSCNFHAPNILVWNSPTDATQLHYLLHNTCIIWISLFLQVGEFETINCTAVTNISALLFVYNLVIIYI